MNRRTALGLIARSVTAAAILPLVGTGCGRASGSDRSAARTTVHSNPRPVRLALFVDKSKSVIQNDVHPPRLEELAPLVDLLGVVGGELAVGRIALRSNVSLARLRIEAAPAAPERPSQDMNPLDLNDATEAYSHAIREHKKRMDVWTKETAQNAETFLSRVRPILEGPPDASITDIWGAVRRAEMFLSEPLNPSQVEPLRVLVLVTDGIDTAHSRPITPSSPVETVLVGVRDIERFQALSPKRFESTNSAFQWVVDTARGTYGGK